MLVGPEIGVAHPGWFRVDRGSGCGVPGVAWVELWRRVLDLLNHVWTNFRMTKTACPGVVGGGQSECGGQWHF